MSKAISRPTNHKNPIGGGLSAPARKINSHIKKKLIKLMAIIFFLIRSFIKSHLYSVFITKANLNEEIK
ncbi:hypothetical protein J32TS6_01060 [Virgibacillus pantothenticus]|nr:hypothetical protein J32TS6_01060 [Virgibacillus pantothenticus]